MTYLASLAAAVAVLVGLWLVLRIVGDVLAWWTDTIEDDFHD